MTGFSAFETAVQQRWDGAALVANAAGKQILGYLDTGFPEELAIAAGMVPVLLTGDPQGTTTATDGHVDAGIPGRARQLYEGFLTGRYDFADAVVITGGDRYLANTYGFLRGYREATDQGPTAKLFYLERARGTYREHRDFNRDRIALLRRSLAEFTGTAIDDEALGRAIILVNTTRRLLKQLTQLRIATPGIVSGTQAATIALASRLMPKEQFNETLQAFLDELPAEPTQPARLKVFLTGSPIDHRGVHEAIEAAGAIVVGEDVEFAGTHDQLLVREDLDPIEAMADRYTFKFPDRWGFGRERRITWNAKTIRASNADSVLFFHSLYDSSTGWDFPDLRATLERDGITVHPVQDQRYLLASQTDLHERMAATVQGMSARQPAPVS